MDKQIVQWCFLFHYYYIVVDILSLCLVQIKIAPKQIQSEQKEMEIIKGLDDPEKLNVVRKSYATPEELEGGKLPPEEILSLPMFKVNFTNS